MLQKAFNEQALWKGKIQKYNSGSKLIQPPMDLPKINSLTGHYDPPRRPSLSEEREYQYSLYSAEYWRGVRERQRAYRIFWANQLS
jgi:hypothetical protein